VRVIAPVSQLVQMLEESIRSSPPTTADSGSCDSHIATSDTLRSVAPWSVYEVVAMSDDGSLRDVPPGFTAEEWDRAIETGRAVVDTSSADGRARLPRPIRAGLWFLRLTARGLSARLSGQPNHQARQAAESCDDGCP